ncbi:MAG: stage II sporulation protein M [Clostridium sp.]|nr:stage II sporulation protein M [Clostridium sp.]
MKIESIKEECIRHFQGNLWLYLFSSICLCTGIVLGVYTVKYMSSFDKSDLISYMTSFTSSGNFKNINYEVVFLEVLKTNIPQLIIIWFLGLTMIGIPIILVMDIIKGFTLGFTVTFFINGMGMKGIWLSLFSVIPQNIIYIPCVIISSVIAMEFSFMLIKDNSNKNWTKNISSKILSYSLIFIGITAVMFIGFVFETYVTPFIIRAIA